MEFLDALILFITNNQDTLAHYFRYIFAFGYFCPTVFAIITFRGPRQILRVFFLNLFLGWTIKFWFVALVVAALPTKREMEANA